MSVKRSEESIVTPNGSVHCYFWRGPSHPARVVVLVHGLLMHGRMFDTLATQIASENTLVVAPDLRGFGRNYFGSIERSNIDYAGSVQDVSELISWLGIQFPDAPIVLAGESLGAHLARDLAANCADRVSGLVLSSPCMRPRVMSFDLVPKVFAQLVQAGIYQRLEADLVPFATKFLNEEPENLQHYLEDPMCRKSVDLLELIESMLIVGSFQPKRVPENMPLLVYRGKNDGVCRSASYNQFMSSLVTNESVVVECDSCAHLILQSKKICPEVLLALESWLASIK